MEAVPFIGARLLENDHTEFIVWAQRPQQIELLVQRSAGEPDVYPLEPVAGTRDARYYGAVVANVPAGTRYAFRLNGERVRPDPASRCQPDGVHGFSQVVDHRFDWHDAGWQAPPLYQHIFYELHVGTFTPEGTFEAIIGHLPRLRELGVTTLELMPVAQFPGERNWGYDGVYPYAVQASYGGLFGLKRLVDACHQQGLTVFLDVVYNHLGPEGNYLGEYAPYFTDRHRSPWGDSLNFDGPYSDEVRHYFLRNAVYWFEEFHIDGLRLDATDHIYDYAAIPFLQELTHTVQQWSEASGRPAFLVAENDRSDVRLTRPREEGGIGMHAQWLDDLHHVLHTHLTGERAGYYEDYADHSVALLAKSLHESFTYSGDYSRFRKRRHGSSARGVPADRFVVALQNHDQVGNRLLGERIGALADDAGVRLGAALVLLSPYIPLLFMGEEYGETAPFLFFTHFSDTDLIEAVRRGRAAEFVFFKGDAPPADPHDADTFARSRLNPSLIEHEPHQSLYAYYRRLIHLRRTLKPLANPNRQAMRVALEGSVLLMQREGDGETVWMAFNLDLEQPVQFQAHLPHGRWKRIMQPDDTQATPARIDASAAIPLELPPKGFVVYHSKGQDQT
jgi:maltooligosyltrehalose trehalohydrolase